MSNKDPEKDIFAAPYTGPNTDRVTRIIKNHSFKLLKASLIEFYDAPVGRIIFNKEETKVVRTTAYKAQEEPLMKAEFAADVCAQIQKSSGLEAALLASQAVIIEAHKSLGKKPAKTFTGLPSTLDAEDNPFLKMRSLLFSCEGVPVKDVSSPLYAARAVLGEILLGDPVYSIEIGGERTKQLVRGTFMLG
jgi:hypothetical protein